ncbi:MAG: histidinol-phosphate transaminase [Oscillospiraceae bacterium]|nr:histidinol-phosphate transaminase [Oscillospiraceae bacterium]
MINYRENLKKMEPYVPGRPIESVKKEYNLTEAVKLASNENPLGCSPDVAGAVMKTFGEAQLYPDGNCTALREAVSKRYNISPNRLVFGAGTDDVIAMLGKILIDSGDECITGAVTFSQYAAAVDSMGGTTIYAPMKNHGYDLDGIIGKINDKTKMIFIANPNNPTGTMHTAARQAAFMAEVPGYVTVVFDEAYQEFADNSDYPDTWQTLKQYKNAVLLKTFSKIYGLASFRVGFGAMDEEMAEQIEKIRCPFNVSVQGQAAAEAALADVDFVRGSFEKNRENLLYTTGALEEMGLFVIPSQANFVMADVKRDSLEIFEALMKRGYIIRAGAAFGMDTFIRVTIGTRKQMEGFIQALKCVLA